MGDEFGKNIPSLKAKDLTKGKESRKTFF